MKNLNKLSFQCTSLITIMLCLSSTTGAQGALTLKWGVVNTRYCSEDKKSISKWKNLRLFRSEFYNAECQKRYQTLWDNYVKECERQGKKSDEDEFKEKWKKEDSFCWGLIKQAAPTLYFDFVAPTPNRYILEAIDIEGLFKGLKSGSGGFIENEAWYDIVLQGRGATTYDMKRRLVFQNNGRIQLRFWGKPALYVIKINFKFQVAGRVETVTTDPFIIDIPS